MAEHQSTQEIVVSLCIVNWNTQQLTVDLLRSAEETLRDLNYDIVDVDTASTDNSVSLIQAESPTVRLIENRTNIGYGAAVNQAIRVSQGRYVLVLNSDILLTPTSIQQLI